MKRLYKLCALVFLAIVVSGCATIHSKPAESEVFPTPTNDSTIVVFMRNSFVLGGVGTNIFENSDSELSFAGSLHNGQKLAHRTSPGKKVFMTYSGQTQPGFLAADLEPNKTYYVIIRPVWPSQFFPTAVRSDGTTKYNTDSKAFSKWLKVTTRVEIAETGPTWFEKNKEKLIVIFDKNWSPLSETDTDQLPAGALRASDGI